MTEKLKLCPFCGGEAFLVDDDEKNYGVFIACSKCCSSTGIFKTKDEALIAWNTRQVEGELLKKYENALFKICFCCAAVDCSLEQQSEALKAIDKICAEFYSIPEEELRGKNERR